MFEEGSQSASQSNNSVQVTTVVPLFRASIEYHLRDFIPLCKEMDAYTGPTNAEKVQLSAKVREAVMNSSGSVIFNDRDKFIEDQISSALQANIFFFNKFRGPFYLHSIPIIIMACNLSEALINSMISVGLSLQGATDLFPFFDRLDLKQKWLIGPRLLQGCKPINQGHHSFEKLSKLVKIRNELVHSKPRVQVGAESKQTMKGNIKGISMERHMRNDVLSFAELPDHLFDYIVSQFPDAEFRFMLSIAKL
jgi:hypothetical protein